MIYIYGKTSHFDYTNYYLMDEKTKFKSKSAARAHLFALGFNRREIDIHMRLFAFRNPPIWFKVPSDYKGEF